MLAIIVFTILILNLIIAILQNTYNIFNTKSNGLYLSKILMMRDDLQYDEHYGAFILGLSPLNIVTIPFLPIVLFMKPSTTLIKINGYLMAAQYLLFMSMLFAGFLAISIILLPIAYLYSVVRKAKVLSGAQTAT